MATIPIQPNKLRLTKKAVEALIANRGADGPRRYWDTELPGFYLQFTPAGVASFCLRYTKPCGEKGDYTIARAALVGPDQARDVAKERLAQLVLKGVDPVEARLARRENAQQVKEMTFEKVARHYIAARINQRPAARFFPDEWVLETYIFPKFGRLHIDSINTQMVKDHVLDTQALVAKRNVGHTQERPGKVTANRVHAVMRRVFTWAVDGNKAHMNPAAFKSEFSSKSTKRKGVVTEERFRLIWQELDEKAQIKRQPTPLAIRLFMLTLQRPIDIARARREHFDLVANEWRIPWSLTKTEDPYIIPLSGPVLELVQEAFSRTDSEYLFPGNRYSNREHLGRGSMGRRFKRAVEELSRRGVWPEGRRIELYDFRRFGRTQLVHKLKFSKEVAERVINHAEKSDIDERYDVHQYDEELRAAHVAWGEEVSRMVCGHAAE